VRFWLPVVDLATVLAGSLLLSADAAPANPPLDPAFFDREIKPILAARCLGCHGVDNRLAKLDLRSKASALTGGTHGAALVPGNASKSLMYQLVSGVRTPLMPPGGKLPAAEIAKLRRWLDAGAPWAEGPVQDAQKQVWWSFKPPVLPKVPVFKPGVWSKNPIDGFILAKLRDENLAPNPPAPRPVLIRRAYLDVIGIPPTPEEVDAFVRDQSPTAWEKVVDRLLASPHYGERWGRHWLDLVRYADSSGFEGDKDRPNAWRYRDYVIRAFNDDKPYDQFIREQIAGDELVAAGEVNGSTGQRGNGGNGVTDAAAKPGSVEPLPPPPVDPTAERWIATGYLGHGQEDFAMVKLPTTRADELDDMVSTTGSVFLGLTIGCARCHDHKYDPVKQTDYYRLAAIFAPTVRKDVDVPTQEERQAAVQRNRELDAEAAPLKTEAAKLLEAGTKAAMAAGNAKPSPEQATAALPEPDRKRANEVQAALKAVEARRPQLPKAMTITDGGKTYEPFHLMIRGDAYQKGELVQPGFITSLPRGTEVVTADAATPSTTGRRRALAEWLASPGNPLPSRVWMNRIWRQHFGRGIVDSTSNFGVNGDLPSHPELLDWLALKFQSGGQRLKPMHRLMLLSNTYRQSSAVRQEALSIDPQNRYLWRMPVRRLEAEAVRDSILTITGALNREMGGPPVYPPVDASLRADTYQGINWPEGEDSPKTWRRSVYVKVKRSLILPALEVFDCPEITASVAQRNVSVTPTQALLLLNDPLIHRQAEVFAARLKKEAGDAPRQQVDRAYRVAFGRLPTERERSLALTFLQKRSLPDFCHALLNLNELVYVP